MFFLCVCVCVCVEDIPLCLMSYKINKLLPSNTTVYLVFSFPYVNAFFFFYLILCMFLYKCR